MTELTCRICGCTDSSACLEKSGQPCGWVNDDLCSACWERITTDDFSDIFENIIIERIVQDKQWGGAENDDGRSEAEWQAIIEKFMERLVDCMGAPTETYRADLVKIAAVAVAALEAHDRRAQ